MSDQKTGAQRQAERLAKKAAAQGPIIQGPPTRQQLRHKARQNPKRSTRIHLFVRPRPPKSHILTDFMRQGVNFTFHATKGWRAVRREV